MPSPLLAQQGAATCSRKRFASVCRDAARATGRRGGRSGGRPWVGQMAPQLAEALKSERLVGREERLVGLRHRESEGERDDLRLLDQLSPPRFLDLARGDGALGASGIQNELEDASHPRSGPAHRSHLISIEEDAELEGSVRTVCSSSVGRDGVRSLRRRRSLHAPRGDRCMAASVACCAPPPRRAVQTSSAADGSSAGSPASSAAERSPAKLPLGVRLGRPSCRYLVHNAAVLGTGSSPPDDIARAGHRARPRRASRGRRGTSLRRRRRRGRSGLGAREARLDRLDLSEQLERARGGFLDRRGVDA